MQKRTLVATMNMGRMTLAIAVRGRLKLSSLSQCRQRPKRVLCKDGKISQYSEAASGAGSENRILPLEGPVGRHMLDVARGGISSDQRLSRTIEEPIFRCPQILSTNHSVQNRAFGL
jgi:hypothetical protein